MDEAGGPASNIPGGGGKKVKKRVTSREPLIKDTE